MEPFTKEKLIQNFQKIHDMDWIPERRSGNQGSAGNTLEDLLGIEENNLPIPNAAEWELKTHKLGSAALTTLLHSEPSPRALKLVPGYLLPKFGWKHKEAGKKYSITEKSFRQTISAANFSNRGFKIEIDNQDKKIKLRFEGDMVTDDQIDYRAQLVNEFNVQKIANIIIPIESTPYWGFDDLFHAMGTKLTNTFFVEVEERKTEHGKEFRYAQVTMLKKFSIEKFLVALKNGYAFVDFDARTGHNHGTKFRIKSNRIHELYEESNIVVRDDQ